MSEVFHTCARITCAGISHSCPRSVTPDLVTCIGARNYEIISTVRRRLWSVSWAGRRYVEALVGSFLISLYVMNHDRPASGQICAPCVLYCGGGGPHVSWLWSLSRSEWDYERPHVEVNRSHTHNVLKSTATCRLHQCMLRGEVDLSAHQTQRRNSNEFWREAKRNCWHLQFYTRHGIHN